MARGLLGPSHELWFRHKRSKALREADLVLLAGVPCDVRLDYGLQINRKATLVAVNRSEADAKKNRRPQLTIVADATEVLCALAERAGSPGGSADREASRASWLGRLRARDDEREQEIVEQTKATLEPM